MKENVLSKKNILLLASCLFLVVGCGGGGGGDDDDDETGSGISDPVEVANSFGSAIVFPGGDFQAGPPPTPDFTLNSNEVDGGAVAPGDTATVTPDFGNATNGLSLTQNVTVNVAFSGGAASQAAGFTTISATVADINNGNFNGVFSVPPDMCAGLADIQHQIRCYESVTLPDGTVVSTSQARNMILACDGSGGACPVACAADESCINGTCVGTGPLRFSLSWSANVDIDLHVITPSTAEISFSNRLADGGTLDVDNTSGGSGSVENIFFDATAASGTYTYFVNNFDNFSSSWQLLVYRNGAIVATQSGSFAASTFGTDSTRFTITY